MATTNALNTGYKITLGGTLDTAGSVEFVGAYSFEATLTGATAVTFPTSGTLATTGGASIPGVVQGDLLYGSAANVLSALVKDTNATRYLANTGTSNNPAWAQVDLSNGVTSTLPVTNGGTGLATLAQGDLLYSSAANTLSALTKDANATRYLSNQGTSNNPSWSQVNLSNGITGSLPVANIAAITASRAVVSDASGFISAATTTSTEIGYVNGVTSAIQTQIDNKGNYQPCLIATVFNLNATFTNGDTLTNAGTQVAFSHDGVTPSVGSRILVKNQSTALQNGIYTLTVAGDGSTNWVLVRASDMPTATQITLGRMVFVARGTVNAGSYWGVFGSSNETSSDDIFFSNVFYYAARQAVQQGFRLTLTSGTPVTTSDVTAATTVYMTPYLNNLISLYDSNISLWMLYQTAQISVAVPSNTNTPFDIFAYLSTAGVVTLEAVAWTNATTRATAITTQDGVYVKSGTVARRYIGTLCTTGVSGQTEDSEANRFCWNYYNRVMKSLVKESNDTSWSYASNTIRQANGDTNNTFNVVIGVNEDIVSAEVHTATSGADSTSGLAAIALDSTSSQTTSTIVSCITNVSTIRQHMSASFREYVGIGRHALNWIEAADGTCTFYGATTFSGVVTKYGMCGSVRC